MQLQHLGSLVSSTLVRFLKVGSQIFVFIWFFFTDFISDNFSFYIISVWCTFFDRPHNFFVFRSLALRWTTPITLFVVMKKRKKVCKLMIGNEFYLLDDNKIEYFLKFKIGFMRIYFVLVNGWKNYKDKETLWFFN